MPASRSGPLPQSKTPEYVEDAPRRDRSKYAGPIVSADGKLKDKTDTSEEQKAAQQAEDNSPTPPQQTPEESDSSNGSKPSKKD